MKKILDALKSLGSLTELSSILHIAMHCKDIVWLDSEIVALRDFEHLPSHVKKNMDKDGMPTLEYSYLVKLGKDLYLGTEEKELKSGQNIVFATEDLKEVNRWSKEDAEAVAEGIREAKAQGSFIQLSGKNERNVMAEDICIYDYLQALLDRRVKLINHLRDDLDVSDAESIFGPAPATVAEFLNRKEQGVEIMMDMQKGNENFPEVMDLLNTMGMVKKKGGDTFH